MRTVFSKFATRALVRYLPEKTPGTQGHPASVMHTRNADNTHSGSGAIAAPDGHRCIYQEVAVLRLAVIQSANLDLTCHRPDEPAIDRP
jgi:hypothetical protein